MSGHNSLQEMLSGSQFEILDPGDAKTIYVDRWGAIVPLVSGDSAETRTLDQPDKAGLLCTVVLKTDGGGDITLTVTGGYNLASATTITLGDAGDAVTFISVPVGTSFYWRVIAQEGTGLTMADVTATAVTGTTVSGTTVSGTTLTGTNLTASKVSITATAVNAAGSAIGNAANLSYGINIVGAADNSKGVILPVATANAVVDVISTVNAKSLLIYPQVNSAIGGLGANAALTLGPTNTGAAAGAQLTTVRLVATNTTQWYVMG